MKKKKEKQKITSENITFVSKEIKREKSASEDYKKAVSIIVVLCVCIVFVVGLYLVNGKYVTKDVLQSTTTTTEPRFDKTTISVATMFDVADDEYYVIAYDKEDEKQQLLYDNIVSGFHKEKIELYTVDLSKKMNKQYYNEEGTENTKPTKAEDVVFTKPTLIIFEKGKVTSYITEYDSIVKKLTATK